MPTTIAPSTAVFMALALLAKAGVDPDSSDDESQALRALYRTHEKARQESIKERVHGRARTLYETYTAAVSTHGSDWDGLSTATKNGWIAVAWKEEQK